MHIPHIPSPHRPRLVGVLQKLQKRQTDVSPNSDSSLFPHVDNKVGLIVGVGLAVAAILALLLGGLVKRYCLRRRKSNPESSPGETKIPSRRPSCEPCRPSDAGSDRTDATLCTASPFDSEKVFHHHVPRPPSVLLASHTLVPPLGSRPSSALSVATTASQYTTVQAERSKSWESIAQRLDEKADARESKHKSIASTLPALTPLPPSPRTPTSPSSPISIPSPVSFKDSKRQIYGNN